MSKYKTTSSRPKLPPIHNPRNYQAEAAVLGSALMEPDYVLDEIGVLLKPDDFFTHAHRIIFQALLEMRDQQIPIDIVSVGSHLADRKLLELIEGRRYLSQLLESFATTTSAGHYAKIIKEKSQLRELVSLGLEVVDKAGDENAPVHTLAEEFKTKLDTLSHLDSGYDFERFDFDNPHVTPKNWQVVDLIRERDLVLWIGPEKQSKTTLLYQLCVNMASGREFLGHRVEKPLSVTYLDFETEPQDFQYRLQRYQELLTPDEYALMEQNLNVYLLRDKLLQIDTEPSLRRGSSGFGLLKHLIELSKSDVIVLDPFQEFASDINEMDNQKVRMALKEMQRLTRERTCIIVHHLRKADERSDIMIHRDFRRWSDRVRGAQAFKGKADSVFGQSLVNHDSLGPILYLGGFGKRIAIDPIPMVDSETTWVWKERMADVDLNDARQILKPNDHDLLLKISKVLGEDLETKRQVFLKLPDEYISESAFYRRIKPLVTHGFLLETPDGRIRTRENGKVGES